MANIEMVIDSIRVSLMNYQQVVILKEKEGERHLPCWIGPAEADAIAVKMQDVYVPRPLTHDFCLAIVHAFKGTVKHVIISDLKNDTFYAKVVLESGGKQTEIDCRPSDALAVAVRVDAPIFADEKVLDIAGVFMNEEGKPTELPPEKITTIKDKTEKKPSQLEMFSESSQEVLNLAEEEAKRLSHNFVGTGHILLALVKQTHTIASAVLGNLGLDLAKAPLEIEASINQQSDIESTEVGLSSAVKKTIELSVMEAKRLGSRKVQPEHILIGLIRQDKGVAATLLKNQGINTEKIYIELIRLYTQFSYGKQL
ncbi:MAG TPA: bifunctional nuclease domain-containing protein [Dehalococcoidales bacterium]|nr:bifunctional nuclease domain-containing protein [Dehalococcoidales bacterium]